MRTLRHETPTEFLELAGEFLAAREALNNLFFGIAGDANAGRYTGDNLWLSALEDEEVVGAAFQTPPFQLALAHGSSPEAIRALAHEALAQREDALDGLRAPQAYVSLIEDEFGFSYEPIEGVGIYELTQVLPPRSVSGSMRKAALADRERIVEFAFGFAADTGAVSSTGAALAARIETLLNEGLFVVWELEGELVSMAAARGPTPRGIRINWVYTPPNLRGRGYASALVAALSQRELDAGREFCFLFTDLANSTANALYQRIGYQRVGEMGVYRRAASST